MSTNTRTKTSRLKKLPLKYTIGQSVGKVDEKSSTFFKPPSRHFRLFSCPSAATAAAAFRFIVRNWQLEFVDADGTNRAEAQGQVRN